jgi:hypothetical protein
MPSALQLPERIDTDGGLRSLVRAGRLLRFYEGGNEHLKRPQEIKQCLLIYRYIRWGCLM